MADEQIDAAALREAILRGRDSFFFPRDSDLLRLCNEADRLTETLERVRALQEHWYEHAMEWPNAGHHADMLADALGTGRETWGLVFDKKGT